MSDTPVEIPEKDIPFLLETLSRFTLDSLDEEMIYSQEDTELLWEAHQNLDIFWRIVQDGTPDKLS
mgnify:CR=1 FL=1|tara:strand:+ start:1273 stop:1470 length:198 start_codon:yes stop_codon:yes gene_type:complete